MENVYREYNTEGIVKRYKTISNKDAGDVYLIGYLAGDGAYVTNKQLPFIAVNSTEQYIIEQFRDSYCPDNTVYYSGLKSSEKVNAINPVYELRFPIRFSAQLAPFGVFKKKIARRMVGIPKHMLHPYIAGLIDSDGFISVSHRKDDRTPRLRWFITHNSEQYLADVQNALPINTTLRQHGPNVWRLQAQNTSQNLTFLNEVFPYLRNRKKRTILLNYITEYYVPQASGELLESESQSAAKLAEQEGSETT